MVFRPRLLLILAVGCKAETLGVDVPRGGPAAVSQEDLQRDAWLFSEGEVDEHFEERLQQMHVLPAFGSSYQAEGGLVCGTKDGRSGKAIVIAAVGGSEAALARAAVISLAKAWDVQQVPEHTIVFCSWPADGATAYARGPAVPLDATLAAYTLGDLGGATLRLSEAGTLGPAPLRQVGTTPREGAVPDYRVVAEQVREVYARVSRTEPSGQ